MTFIGDVINLNISKVSNLIFKGDGFPTAIFNVSSLSIVPRTLLPDAYGFYPDRYT